MDMSSIEFINGLGPAAIKMSCLHCETKLERESETGNYRCPKPDCGKGGIRSARGITTTVDEDGNILLESTGKPN